MARRRNLPGVVDRFATREHWPKLRSTNLTTARFKKGVPSGAQAHYVAADGSQGVVILETDDLQEGYRNLLNYSEWIEYDTKPYLTLEQALPHISDYIS